MVAQRRSRLDVHNIAKHTEYIVDFLWIVVSTTHAKAKAFGPRRYMGYIVARISKAICLDFSPIQQH